MNLIFRWLCTILLLFFLGIGFLDRSAIGFKFMLYTKIIKDNKDFLNMYKKGRYIASKYTVIYVRPNGRPFNRFGITAGKKIGNAVCRNRAKRLIRLAYRNSEIALPVGIDIVIVARSGIVGIKSDEYCGYFKKYGVREIEKNIRKFQNK